MIYGMNVLQVCACRWNKLRMACCLSNLVPLSFYWLFFTFELLFKKMSNLTVRSQAVWLIRKIRSFHPRPDEFRLGMCSENALRLEKVETSYMTRLSPTHSSLAVKVRAVDSKEKPNNSQKDISHLRRWDCHPVCCSNVAWVLWRTVLTRTSAAPASSWADLQSSVIVNVVKITVLLLFTFH